MVTRIQILENLPPVSTMSSPNQWFTARKIAEQSYISNSLQKIFRISLKSFALCTLKLHFKTSKSFLRLLFDLSQSNSFTPSTLL